MPVRVMRSGCLFDSDKPTFNIKDFHQVLPKICRFNGCCFEFYSVAQHVCLMYDQYMFHPLKWHLLFHDGPEVYYQDITTGWKTEEFKKMAEKVDVAYYKWLGLNWNPEIEEFVHRVDMTMLATEYRDLMPKVESWQICEEKGWQPFPNKIEPWDSGKAEKELFKRVCCYTNYRELTK